MSSPSEAATSSNRPLIPKPGIFARFPRRPDQLVESITPLDGIFILAHFGVPDIHDSLADWTLAIDGMVRRQIELSPADIMRRPKRTVVSVHECAGNPLQPKRAGRTVANVVWGGAELKEILEEAGIDPAARYIWSYGVDYGKYGKINADAYVKDLPIERLEAGDVLLVYEMNGEPLTLEHGAPLRLFVPGYYGTNCVKWLRRMTIADRRADGPMTTILYNDRIPLSQRAPNDAPTRPVWEIAPESVIVAPAPKTELPAGDPVEIWGWAWSASGVARVEVSVDGGAIWDPTPARLADREGWAWQRFSYEWRPDAAGAVTIASRATTADGVTQPAAGARNSVYSVSVLVK